MRGTLLKRWLLSALWVALLTPVMPVAWAAEPPRDTDKRPLTPVTLAAAVQEGVERERVKVLGAPAITAFQIPDPKNPLEARVVVQSPAIICPMLIVPVDPSIDPKLVAPVPEGTTFTMRSVAAAVCR